MKLHGNWAVGMAGVGAVKRRWLCIHNLGKTWEWEVPGVVACGTTGDRVSQTLSQARRTQLRGAEWQQCTAPSAQWVGNLPCPRPPGPGEAVVREVPLQVRGGWTFLWRSQPPEGRPPHTGNCRSPTEANPGTELSLFSHEAHHGFSVELVLFYVTFKESFSGKRIWCRNPHILSFLCICIILYVL